MMRSSRAYISSSITNLLGKMNVELSGKHSWISCRMTVASIFDSMQQPRSTSSARKFAAWTGTDARSEMVSTALDKGTKCLLNCTDVALW